MTILAICNFIKLQMKINKNSILIDYCSVNVMYNKQKSINQHSILTIKKQTKKQTRLFVAKNNCEFNLHTLQEKHALHFCTISEDNVQKELLRSCHSVIKIEELKNEMT